MHIIKSHYLTKSSSLNKPDVFACFVYFCQPVIVCEQVCGLNVQYVLYMCNTCLINSPCINHMEMLDVGICNHVSS